MKQSGLHNAVSVLYGPIKAGLIVAVVLCSVLQWSAERRIVTQTIFDARHAELTQDFHLFTAALEAEVIRECASGSIRRIYFDDSDVGLVYIVNAEVKDPNCKPVRELPITRFNPAQLVQCPVTIIKETNPSWWGSGLFRATLWPVTPFVSSIRKWSSPDGIFAFEVYRKSGCPRLVEGESE